MNRGRCILRDGYLDLSAYGDAYQYSGNLGILDLAFALEWVQENIEQFGGEPGISRMEQEKKSTPAGSRSRLFAYMLR